MSDLANTLTARQKNFIIFALALGGFAIGIGEFSPMGLLLEVSRGLQVSETQASHGVSVYALAWWSARRCWHFLAVICRAKPY